MKRKRIYKTVLFWLSLAMVLFCNQLVTKAASVNDGIGTNIIKGEDNSGEVEIEIRNSNYYEVTGINYNIEVSDNAQVEGDVSNTNISISANGIKTYKIKAELKELPTDKPEDSGQGGPAQGDSTTDKDEALNINNAMTSMGSSVNTGDSNGHTFMWIGIGLFALMIIIAVKRKNKRLLSCILIITIVATGISINAFEAKADEIEYKIVTESKDVEISGEKITIKLIVEYPVQSELRDNTLEELREKNGNQLDIVYGENDNITFLNGSYTDYRVTNVDTALSSLQAVSTILNIKDKDISLLPILKKTSDNGDTYYTFQQCIGNVMLSNAFITIGADSAGNTLCISNSLLTGDIKEPVDINISSNQALLIADSIAGDKAERTEKEPMLDYLYTESKLCWVVYYKMKQEDETESFEKKTLYYKFYIGVDNGGLYSYSIVTSITDSRVEDQKNDQNIYFDGVQTQLMQFTDYKGESVELPVAMSENGKYYFIDVERKILGVDTAATKASGFQVPTFYTFTDPANVPAPFVSAIENMIKVYDYYNRKGIQSIDGNGLPLMVGLGFQENGVEIANASYKGNLLGWGIFMFSNTYISAGLDVAAHEFTHGVKSSISGNASYTNESGAIEESYADILGNLLEMIVDPQHADLYGWKLGETTGSPVRSMSNPHEYMQPEYIGDTYYLMKCVTPSRVNDNGGVHTNNSILSHICYLLNQYGIRMEENFDIWLNTLLIFNPNATYDDVRGYVTYITGRMNRTDTEQINQIFESANLENSSDFSWNQIEAKEGYTKVHLQMDNMPDTMAIAWQFSLDGKKCYAGLNQQGTYTMLVPNGNYDLKLRVLNTVTDATKAIKITGTGVNGTWGISGGEQTIKMDWNTVIMPGEQLLWDAA